MLFFLSLPLDLVFLSVFSQVISFPAEAISIPNLVFTVIMPASEQVAQVLPLSPSSKQVIYLFQPTVSQGLYFFACTPIHKKSTLLFALLLRVFRFPGSSTFPAVPNFIFSINYSHKFSEFLHSLSLSPIAQSFNWLSSGLLSNFILHSSSSRALFPLICIFSPFK